MEDDRPRLRLTIEFRDTREWAPLIWTIRQIIGVLNSAPAKAITVRFERVDRPGG